MAIVSRLEGKQKREESSYLILIKGLLRLRYRQYYYPYPSIRCTNTMIPQMPNTTASY